MTVVLRQLEWKGGERSTYLIPLPFTQDAQALPLSRRGTLELHIHVHWFSMAVININYIIQKCAFIYMYILSLVGSGFFSCVCVFFSLLLSNFSTSAKSGNKNDTIVAFIKKSCIPGTTAPWAQTKWLFRLEQHRPRKGHIKTLQPAWMSHSMRVFKFLLRNYQQRPSRIKGWSLIISKDRAQEQKETDSILQSFFFFFVLQNLFHKHKGTAAPAAAIADEWDVKDHHLRT